MDQKWNVPLRIIQTNLQVTDALDLDVERLTEQILELKANALVFNVGGIYAWYPTKIPFHRLNPLMGTGRDVVGEVVEACRKRGILFIARYDFSKASDHVYRQHPEWFVRRGQNRPQMVAQDRLGEWDQLVSTCLHGGYQNEAVAYPVLRESMERYHPDGIFITSMIYAPCQCESCRSLYRERYHAELPQDPGQYAPGFAEDMMDESVLRYQEVVKAADPDAAFLHRVMLGDGRTDQEEAFRHTKWWFPRTGEYNLFFDHPIDLIHGETHDSLTGGAKSLAARYTPGLAMKIARSLPHTVPPIDIVHSAPGLGWRHTGLPAAEHRFWASQVPANGGQIWHSLTGIPDHVPDKGQLEVARWVNSRAEKLGPLMQDAKSAADVALLWNDLAGHGWAAGLTAARIPYDILLQRQVAGQGIPGQYRWVICPEQGDWTESTLQTLERYVQSGGGLVLEGRLRDPRLKKLAGLVGSQQESERLSTGYLEPACPALREEIGAGPLLPLSGCVQYGRYDGETDALVTLVPPFAPPEGAGSPPERAVLPRVEVPWPMVARRGRVLHCAFPFHDLLETYGLRSHLQLLDALLSGPRLVRSSEAPGLQLSVFRVRGGYLVHLVNGAGERPLQDTVKLHSVTLQVTLPGGERFDGAQWMFGGDAAAAEAEGCMVTVKLPPLGTWEALLIRTKEGE